MALVRFLIFLITAGALVSALINPLAAHEGRPVYIEVTERSSGSYELRWKIPPVIAVGEEPMIRLSGAECTLAAGAPRPSLAGTQLYTCSGDIDGAGKLQVDLHYPGTNPVLSTLVLYRTLDGNEQSIMTSPDETSVLLPGAETFWQVARRYTSTGIQHILDGYDHLLFVLCLILLAGTMRRILITVTGFTLGHSITLGFSALAGWSLQPTFVEPLIAFSIVILAAEIARGKNNTLTAKYPAIVATGFGLLHGFGFGGALAEIGLPYGLKIQALAFFNVGVEIGQILFVVAAFMAYWLARQIAVAAKATAEITDNIAQMKAFVIYPTGIVATFWTLQRLAGIW